MIEAIPNLLHLISYGLLGALCVFFVFRMFVWKMRYSLAKEKLSFLEANKKELKETFGSLSFEALEKNNKAFLDLAKSSLSSFHTQAKVELDHKEEKISSLVTPVKESLSKLSEGLLKLESERKTDHTQIKTHLGALLSAKEQLYKETRNLTRALRTPHVRGRWGEIQLRRVVEMAGMVNHCDFYEQKQSAQGDLRPDLVIRLPSKRQVIVDSKVPLSSYLDAMELEEGSKRDEHLKNHAQLVRSHVIALSKKSYHAHFTPTPEFVILFLPSEGFFSAALESDPSLVELGADRGVILATPTTLIALLRTVSYGWKEESLSEHAQKVSELGHELYKRIYDMNCHFEKMGSSLSSTIKAYNQGMGSLESRVLVSARKFKEMGAASSSVEIDSPKPIEISPRQL